MSASRHLVRSVGVVGSFTGLSRILGMCRDILMASAFGTSYVMSAFVLAFTIPNLFRRLFGEGALSSAFVPVFVKLREEKGDGAAWLLAGQIASLLFVFLCVVVAGGWILFSSLDVWMNSRLADLTFMLLQVMFPYMLLICMAALAMSALHSFGHFSTPAFAPCLLNLLWIFGLLLMPLVMPETFSPERKVFYLSFIILFAGVCQLGIQIPILRRYGFRCSFQWAPKNADVQRVLRLMGPAALGMAVTQLNVMFDRLLAAAIGNHAPAALFFSERLIYLPLGLFATAMGTVLLPMLSSLKASDNEKRLQSVQSSFRMLALVMVPAAFGLFVLAEPLVVMLLQSGEFQSDSVFYTSVALRFYAPGLLVFSLAKVFVPVFYSVEDMKTPLRLGIVTVGLNLCLNLLFFFTWPGDYKHAGLALATVLSESVYVFLLAICLHRKFGNPGWGKILAALFRFLVLAALMAWFARWSVGALRESLAGGGMAPKVISIGSVLGGISLSATVYFSLAVFFRFEEMKWLIRGLKKSGRE